MVRNLGKSILQRFPIMHLEHGVCEEGLQHPSLTCSVGLILFQQLVKVSVLFAVSQNLQAVLMVTHKLLVDVQHGKQNVKEISCRNKNTHRGREG